MTTVMKARNPTILFTLTLLLAYCSIIYELLLAQTLTAVLGNTIFQYNLTIGVYIAALGVGFISYRSIRFTHALKRLITIEILLALLGTLSPFIILWADSLLMPLFLYCISYGMIITIGLLSGFELPLLMDIAKEYHAKSSLKILGIDYIGSMVGAMTFPLLLLPLSGLFGTAIFTGLLNGSAAFILYVYYNTQQQKWAVYISIAALFIMLLLFTQTPHIHNYIVHTLYLHKIP